ncbi:hypothetical protein Cylst_5027 [Cylindrospermum stagnale PCC 7417]|uniref:Uncharacterized protein n=1 Tax=Cylindrospermum stagnale PCC 7417 TaxID=56107 RepID=K9X639_9NOST|nr:hypothetical protein [Cylindrospermum stagnale]AFZ27077.1 hypothetical protein Cylst_5027 [Cylindrospermum stagnale PCC 7417]
MVKEKLTDREQRLEDFLQAVEAAQKLQDDIMEYGLDAAYLYCDDIDGDWLERWGEDDDEPGYIELMTNFLESDDSVAVKVRQQLQDKAISEIIEDLELCLSELKESDRIFAMKNLLVGGVASSGSNRDSGDDINEIEFLDLAESLLDKLTEILG